MARGALTAALVAALLAAGCGRAPSADDAPAASREARKADLEVELPGGVSMAFVLVPPGAFTMGAADGFAEEKPPHRVEIAKAFHLGRDLVTQEQWRAVMGADPSRRKGARRPVENVTWEECAAFVARLDALAPGAKFSLPSEARWEYACRAGSTTKWCFGDDEPRLAQFAWYLADSGRSTHDVGTRLPNAWGLFDLHGNVWEWCADAWHADYVGAPADGRAWTEGGDLRRVRRGGSWYDSAWLARSSSRLGLPTDFRSETVGLRVARDAAQ